MTKKTAGLKGDGVTDDLPTLGEMVKQAREERSVLIEVQFRDPGAVYSPLHVDVALNPTQGEALKCMRHALQSGGCKLKSGRFVESFADTVRYLLEQISEGAKAQNGH